GGKVGQARAGDGVGAGDQREDHQRDQQAEVPAADEQVPLPLPAALDDAQQDRVRGEESPEVVGDAEHAVLLPLRVVPSLWLPGSVINGDNDDAVGNRLEVDPIWKTL